ncbi:hypothetical protein CTI12_AA166650 [Artemisia annua]|uniref:Uncharacterized protein n=1 Tax=Artemisia annua TaxID=35608 RepID=A0A2U1PD63_ARTAN|nr:hypothetical protein CTI12_AA166650 [Artemisia annua]
MQFYSGALHGGRKLKKKCWDLGIPNPDEEVKMWMEFRDKLESLMVVLDKKFIAKACLEF